MKIFSKLAEYKQWIIRIVVCRISFHNYRNIGRWHLRLTKSMMTYTDGKDIMHHIRLGFNEIRITIER